MQVSAHDQDTLDADIIYSLSGEGSRNFDIDTSRGEVTVKDKQGLEEGKNFLLQVKVSSYHLESEAIYKVSLTNMNIIYDRLMYAGESIDIRNCCPLSKERITLFKF